MLPITYKIYWVKRLSWFFVLTFATLILERAQRFADFIFYREPWLRGGLVQTFVKSSSPSGFTSSSSDERPDEVIYRYVFCTLES